jgi:hypothetical protein
LLESTRVNTLMVNYDNGGILTQFPLPSLKYLRLGELWSAPYETTSVPLFGTLRFLTNLETLNLDSECLSYDFVRTRFPLDCFPSLTTLLLMGDAFQKSTKHTDLFFPDDVSEYFFTPLRNIRELYMGAPYTASFLSGLSSLAGLTALQLAIPSPFHRGDITQLFSALRPLTALTRVFLFLPLGIEISGIHELAAAMRDYQRVNLRVINIGNLRKPIRLLLRALQQEFSPRVLTEIDCDADTTIASDSDASDFEAASDSDASDSDASDSDASDSDASDFEF